MYYATKRNNTQTRIIGVAGVVIAISGAGYAIANGFGLIENKPPVETEVVIIEELDKVEDEPPPPPPVDVDLPPPPPQVILPDFVFDQPPPEAAIQQVVVTKTPVQAAVPPAPKPTPAVPPVGPKPNKNKFAEMMTKDYPAKAQRAKQEGDVTVSMCVSIDGRASDVKLVESSGVDSLDEATVKGMTKLTFTPAKDSMGKNTAYCSPPYKLTVQWKLPK